MTNIGVTLTADDRELLKVLQSAGGDIKRFAAENSRAMAGMGTAAGGATDQMGRLAAGMRTAFIGGGIAASIITAKNAIEGLVGAMVDAQMQADKVGNTLSFALGGKTQAATEIAYLRDVTNSLGVSFAAIAPMYGRFAASTRGTNLEGKATREIFESIAKASVVMGLNLEETEGAMRALTQMVSKGQIQAEELRGQLGERLPGSFQLFAKSMGVSTAELSKLLELGQVAPERLREFAAVLTGEVAPSVEAASQRLGASVNRMENEWLRLKQAVADSGVSSYMSGQISILADGFGGVSEAMEGAKKQGDGFLGQMVSGAGAVARFLNPLQAMPPLIEAFGYKAIESGNALKQAEAKLLELKKQSETMGDSFYLKNEIYQTGLYIAKLKEAQAAKAGLTGGDPRHIDPAQTRGASLARWEEQQAKASAELAVIRGKLSGVDRDYLPTLEKLNNARKIGILSEKEYVAMVSDLARKNYSQPGGRRGGAGGGKDPDAEAARYLESLQKQLDKTRDLGIEEAALAEIQSGRLGKVNPALEKQILATARLLDLHKAETDSLKAMEKAALDAANAAGKLYSEAQRMAQDVETPGEKLFRQLDELNRVAGSNPLVTADTVARTQSKYWTEYGEAVRQGTEDLKEADDFAKEMAENVQDMLGQGLYDIMNGSFGDIAQSFTRMIQRMVAEAIAADLARHLMGDMVKGGSGDGLLGSLIKSGVGFLTGGGGGGGYDMYGGATGAQNSAIMSMVTGGSLPSFDVGTDYVPRDMIAMIHKGERIVPAAENRAGGSGQNIIVNVTAPAGTSRASAMQWGAEAGRQMQRAVARNT